MPTSVRLDPETEADQPMDFADASLVQVANRLGLNQVFTLDRRDFGVYRLGKNQGFRMLPAAPA